MRPTSVTRKRRFVLSPPVCSSAFLYLSVLVLIALPVQAQRQGHELSPTASQEGGGDSSAAGSPDLFADLEPPPTTSREIQVSVDYLLGRGKITVPVGFSFSQLQPGYAPLVATPDRESDYLGGTLSLSYGQKWYVDLSYAQGWSSTTFPVELIPGSGIPVAFELDDTWYQAYVRYAFPGLRGKRVSLYLRAGISYVENDLRGKDATGIYVQNNDGSDKLGNLGFGIGYSLYAGIRAKWNLQVEGEAFYGVRDQESVETIAGDDYPRADLDNELYGGTGRATIRFDYGLGRTGLLKILADVGIQVKASQIEYEHQGGRISELLWGPYAKVGLSYSF